MFCDNCSEIILAWENKVTDFVSAKYESDLKLCCHWVTLEFNVCHLTLTHPPSSCHGNLAEILDEHLLHTTILQTHQTNLAALISWTDNTSLESEHGEMIKVGQSIKIEGKKECKLLYMPVIIHNLEESQPYRHRHKFCCQNITQKTTIKSRCCPRGLCICIVCFQMLLFMSPHWSLRPPKHHDTATCVSLSTQTYAQ